MPAPTATGPNGEKLVLEGGAWVPLEPTAAEPPTVPRARGLPGAPTQDAAAIDRMTRDAMKTGAAEFVANLIGLPHALGEVLTAGLGGVSAGLATAADVAGGQPIDVGKRFDEGRDRVAKDSYLARGLLAMPEPTGADVLSAVGVESPTGLGASTGRTTADVATLMTLRPGQRVRDILKQSGSAADRRARLLAREGNSVTREVDEAADTITNKLGRVAGRTAEAGFEGALVGALGEGDPANTAAWSAGIQAAGGLALDAKSWVWKNPSKSALSLWIGHEVWKAVAPGSQNALESKDEVIREMVVAYGLGAVAGLAGAGRPVGPLASALSNASRPAIASVVTQLQEAANRNQPQYERVVAKLAEDPNYFGREARSRLELAANRERPNALLTEIDALMKSKAFREKAEALAAPPTPMKTGGGF